jgi:hypothetical protein
MRTSTHVLGLLVLIACGVLAPRGVAQEWQGRVRGSWLREGPAQAGDVTLASPAAGACEIVVAPAEHSAVKQAASFLTADIERISGKKPAIVEKPTGAGRVAIHLATVGGGVTLPQTIDEAKLHGLWEAYRIVAEGNDVWLVGSDFRGTAFAAYTLSERIGIDPLYIWTGYQPDRHETLVLRKTDQTFDPPTFKYRGMFHDDEDILPRPFEDAGYPLRIGDVPLEWYKRFFETALRLRMNMVAPYTRVHRRYEVQKTASDWGLFYTSHHYDVLLSNPFGMERYGLAAARGVRNDWNWATNRDGMLKYWRGGVEENKDLDCVWPVGMRGTDDTSYKFPAGTSEAAQAKVFHDVLAEQVEMTRKLMPPGKTPVFHWTLYTEMLPKYLAHSLDVPDGVIIVWPDDNDGVMRGLPDKPDGRKHGVYYHLAYLGKQVKQSAHFVHPQRVAEQFRKIVDAGATEYMLVNVSELREFVMEARMLGEICWDAKTAFAGSAGDPAQRYVNWWCREYFGDATAEPAAKAYADYEKCFDTYEKQWYGSERVHELIEAMSRRATGAKGSTALPANLKEELLARRAELKSVLDDAADASKHMDRAQAQFFHDHVVLPTLFDYAPTCAAVKLLEAVEKSDTRAMLATAAEAMPNLETLEVEILRAERPPFEKWYRKTWIRRELRPTNVHRPFEELRAFLASDGRELLQEPPEWRHPDLRKFYPMVAATRPSK